MMAIGDYKFVIAGSGFFGAVMAERIATVLKQPVLVVEKRSHFGGNSFSENDAATGIEYHRYGTHLFHTSSDDVWSWINQFTKFNNYRHRVLTRHHNRMYTMPINLMTLNNFFGVDLKPSEAASFLQSRAEADRIDDPQNLEEKAISLIGRDLYQAFIRGYTAKQWETDPKLLSIACP
jgi:UDP-galactopyranose mutase